MAYILECSVKNLPDSQSAEHILCVPGLPVGGSLVGAVIHMTEQ